ncbi:hypothetical protein [Streptomyces canus]|uniref:hypothetical protein n=1 Tax=Streptomyces canus TaxID=58343 RepID=UPI002E2B9E4B|nr:hypothetical protein [Streptomyces canus]
MVTAPSGIANTGAHLYHLTTGTIDQRLEGCEAGCPYDGMLRALWGTTYPSPSRDGTRLLKGPELLGPLRYADGRYESVGDA